MKNVYEIINSYKPGKYLEIGILNCETLFSVEVGYGGFRVGVDIDPFPLARYRSDVFWGSMSNRLQEDLVKSQRTLIYRMSGDDYFKLADSFLFDVIFIDGFHEYRQVMKDIDNASRFLSKSGVIFLHDTNPLTEMAGMKHKEYYEMMAEYKWKEGEDSFWNGDVWKALVELKERGLEYKTFDIQHGLTAVSCGNFDKKISEDRVKEIDGLSYEFLNKNRKEVLCIGG